MIARRVEVVVRDRRHGDQRVIDIRSVRTSRDAAAAYPVLVLKNNEIDDRFIGVGFGLSFGLGLRRAKRGEGGERQKSGQEKLRRASWSEGQLHGETSVSCCPHPTIEPPVMK